MNHLRESPDFNILSHIKCDFALSSATEIVMLNKFSDIFFNCLKQCSYSSLLNINFWGFFFKALIQHIIAGITHLGILEKENIKAFHLSRNILSDIFMGT